MLEPIVWKWQIQKPQNKIKILKICQLWHILFPKIHLTQHNGLYPASSNALMWLLMTILLILILSIWFYNFINLVTYKCNLMPCVSSLELHGQVGKQMWQDPLWRTSGLALKVAQAEPALAQRWQQEYILPLVNWLLTIVHKVLCYSVWGLLRDFKGLQGVVARSGNYMSMLFFALLQGEKLSYCRGSSRLWTLNYMQRWVMNPPTTALLASADTQTAGKMGVNPHRSSPHWSNL